MVQDMLAHVYEVICSRKGTPPDTSYTASLFAKGRKKICQKIGEEGVETALAGVLDDREEIIKESTDVLYHLMVLWADVGITPTDIAQELQRREGVSGLTEKAARKEL